jgi:hypothetical protein
MVSKEKTMKIKFMTSRTWRKGLPAREQEDFT